MERPRAPHVDQSNSGRDDPNCRSEGPRPSPLSNRERANDRPAAPPRRSPRATNCVLHSRPVARFFERNLASDPSEDSRSIVKLAEIARSEEVEIALLWMLGERRDRPPTQVARLQGRGGLKLERNFALLLRLIAPEERGILWSFNLGELTFSLDQLVRFRKAFSEPTCTITHLFIDPLKRTRRYSRPTESNAPLEAAQRVADSETKKGGNKWKHIFMAQIRANKQKHDPFYFTADETQNAIVRKAVNNWYNPTSHERNRRWDAMRKQRRAL